MFKLPNGNIAKTYLEYLEYYNPELYTLIETSTDIELYQLIEHTISRLQYYIGNLDTLYLMNDSTTELQDYLIKMVLFFKSYTTDLLGMNILYVFNMKPENIIKFHDRVQEIHKTIEPNDKINFSYSDYAVVHAIYHPDDFLEFDEKAFIKKILEIREPKKLIHDKFVLISNIKEKDKLQYYDVTGSILSKIYHKEDLKFRDKCFISRSFNNDWVLDQKHL